MQTFGPVRFQKRLTCCLIMPRLEGIALFHSRKDMDQPFCLAGGFDDFCNAVIFAECFDFSDKLNFDAVITGNLFSVISYLLGKRL